LDHTSLGLKPPVPIWAAAAEGWAGRVARAARLTVAAAVSRTRWVGRRKDI
jgi:hypothetical protein